MCPSPLRLLPALFVAGALTGTPVAAVAQSVTFSGGGTVLTPVAGLTAGAYSFAFTLPQSPTPDLASTFTFNLLQSTGVFTQGAVTTSLTGTLRFTNADAGGGFSFFVAPGGDFLFGVFGPTVFTVATNTLDFPTFTLGSGTPTSNAAAAPATVSSYTIAATSTVPEPGTWALLGTGLVAVGGIAARRKRTTG